MSPSLAAAVALVAFAGTAGALAYGRHRLLDVPTDRSLHAAPTPRGGGIAIAAAYLGGLAVAALFGWVTRDTVLALGGGGLLVAAVGWLDDHRGIPAAARLLVHVGAAAWAIGFLGPLQGGGAGGAIFAGVGIVWAVNLYNFMDGIDGLAAAEAVAVGSASALLLAADRQAGLAHAAALVAAAAVGFLPWNFPRARIFMGDVGSGLLGYLFGTLALASHNQGSLSIAAWLTLLGVFVFDATATLLRRLASGEPVTAPHRRHAYQRLVQAGWRHWQVTLGAVAVTAMLWLIVVWDRRGGGGGWRALGVATLLLGGLYVVVERVAPMRRFADRSGGGYP